MINPEKLERLIVALEKLNGHVESNGPGLAQELQKLNANLMEHSARLRGATSEMKTLNMNLKLAQDLGKHLKMLNHIFLSVSKSAGMAGTVETLLKGVMAFARGAR